MSTNPSDGQWYPVHSTFRSITSLAGALFFVHTLRQLLLTIMDDVLKLGKLLNKQAVSRSLLERLKKPIIESLPQPGRGKGKLLSISTL